MKFVGKNKAIGEVSIEMEEGCGVYIVSSLDLLDTKDVPFAMVKVSTSVASLKEILKNLECEVYFVCPNLLDVDLLDWTREKLEVPIDSIPSFLDYFHPENEDIFVKLDPNTLCFEIIKFYELEQIEGLTDLPIQSPTSQGNLKVEQYLEIREGTFI
jgi:hypothetical protein